MRNEERIPEVLAAVEERWRESPDLRLGQLIFAIAGTDDPFYLEDDELMQRLGEELESEYWVGKNPFEDDVHSKS